ncbi:MAG: hypothetical protein KC457_31065, partial [Myxococcales bacterium]|nr:hypothetical protein [Myxococcales bacterium]
MSLERDTSRHRRHGSGHGSGQGPRRIPPAAVRGVDHLTEIADDEAGRARETMTTLSRGITPQA